MQLDPLQKKGIWLAIFVLWLFHLSGMVGITSGHEAWFLPKTPLNLLVSGVLFFWFYPLETQKKLRYFGLFFLVGMFVEWLGTKYGVLFGSYSYGDNLGPKIDGVPLFIGVYWGLLTFCTGQIAHHSVSGLWQKVTLGAILMVVLDFFMEQSAPKFDFWSFGDTVPLSNYITWFVVSFLLHLVFVRAKIRGNHTIALHLYLVQLVFFIFFAIQGRI